MTLWLVVAPLRDDDEALANTTWIAQRTLERAPEAAIELVGGAITRALLEAEIARTPEVRGLAFFGHGGTDRLFGADRPPGCDGPALIDGGNIGLLSGGWIHAFACWSGVALAEQAARSGVRIYVGYRRPLDAGWECPPSAEAEFVRLVTCTTFSLLEGKRDEREIRRDASGAADDFFLALEEVPDEQKSGRWMWLYALAQQLVDDMVVTIGSLETGSTSG